MEELTALSSWFILTCIFLYVLWKAKALKYTFQNIHDVGERWNPATLTTKHISVLIVFPLLSFLFVLNSRNMLGGGTAHSFIQTAPAGPNYKSCLETHAHRVKNNPPSRVVVKSLLPKDSKRERKVFNHVYWQKVTSKYRASRNKKNGVCEEEYKSTDCLHHLRCLKPYSVNSWYS